MRLQPRDVDAGVGDEPLEQVGETVGVKSVNGGGAGISPCVGTSFAPASATARANRSWVA